MHQKLICDDFISTTGNIPEILIFRKQPTKFWSSCLPLTPSGRRCQSPLSCCGIIYGEGEEMNCVFRNCSTTISTKRHHQEQQQATPHHPKSFLWVSLTSIRPPGAQWSRGFAQGRTDGAEVQLMKNKVSPKTRLLRPPPPLSRHLVIIFHTWSFSANFLLLRTQLNRYQQASRGGEAARERQQRCTNFARPKYLINKCAINFHLHHTIYLALQVSFLLCHRYITNPRLLPLAPLCVVMEFGYWMVLLLLLN